MNRTSNIYQFPNPSKRKRALVLNRKQVASGAFHFEGMLQDFLAYFQNMGETEPACPGITVKTQYVAPLLTQHWISQGILAADVCAQTLVIYLPPEFESDVALLAMCSPEVFNQCNTALRENATYLGWGYALPGTITGCEIWVPEFNLNSALGEAFCHITQKSRWISVVMLAGDTVAFGGFLVTEELIGCAQGATMSAGSSMPEELYGPDELSVASKKAALVGLTPWFDTLWLMDERRVLAATVLACTPY